MTEDYALVTRVFDPVTDQIGIVGGSGDGPDAVRAFGPVVTCATDADLHPLRSHPSQGLLLWLVGTINFYTRCARPGLRSAPVCPHLSGSEGSIRSSSRLAQKASVDAHPIGGKSHTISGHGHHRFSTGCAPSGQAVPCVRYPQALDSAGKGSGGQNSISLAWGSLVLAYAPSGRLRLMLIRTPPTAADAAIHPRANKAAARKRAAPLPVIISTRS